MIVCLVWGSLVGPAYSAAVDAQTTNMSPAYYSIQHSDDWPPLPANILGLPEINLGNGQIAIDDLDVDYDTLAKLLGASGLTSYPQSASNDGPPPLPDGETGGVGSGGGGSSEADYIDYGTNLWLEISGATNNSVIVTAHNTKSQLTSSYQLLSKSDLNESAWAREQLVYNFLGGTNVVFSPVSISNSATKFFKVQQSDTSVTLLAGPAAVEPDPVTGVGGRSGFCTVERLLGPTELPVTVHYSVSGTASNGVDYSNLDGVATIPANSGYVQIRVYPIADHLVEGDESVIVTLQPASGYVIYGDYSHTVTIIDTVFTVVTNITYPNGIDYHPPTQSLLASVNYSSGEPYNFVRISNEGNPTNVFVTTWSQIHGLQDEVKLATVKETANGFVAGDMYFGNGNPGGIGWLSSDGTISNINWVRLPNVTEHLRGSLYLDQSGSFGGDLIAVVGEGFQSLPAKGVWRIQANRTSHLVTNIAASHLEGVITVPNDTQAWGPWAGKILTGNEYTHTIYAISTNGTVTTHLLGIDPEDFDFVPPNQNLYCVNFQDDGNGKLLKLDKTFLTNYVGAMLITDAGEVTPPGKIFFVRWDDSTSSFITNRILLPSSIGGHFEHATFAPIDLPSYVE